MQDRSIVPNETMLSNRLMILYCHICIQGFHRFFISIKPRAKSFCGAAKSSITDQVHPVTVIVNETIELVELIKIYLTHGEVTINTFCQCNDFRVLSVITDIFFSFHDTQIREIANITLINYEKCKLGNLLSLKYLLILIYLDKLKNYQTLAKKVFFDHSAYIQCIRRYFCTFVLLL